MENRLDNFGNFSTEEELVSFCRRIGTSTWSDVLDHLKANGVVDGLTKRSGPASFAGFAVTATQSTGPLGAYPRGDFAVGRMIDAVGPSRVLVVSMGGATVSTFGGLAAIATALRKAEGVVIDGGCRDLHELRATGISMWSRHVTPRTGKTRVQLTAMGKSVAVGGVIVEHGDIVVGDDTGLICIPRGRLAQAVEHVKATIAVDEAMERDIRGGATFAKAAADAKYI